MKVLEFHARVEDEYAELFENAYAVESADEPDRDFDLTMWIYETAEDYDNDNYRQVGIDIYWGRG